jgi:glutamate 5-kinase
VPTLILSGKKRGIISAAVQQARTGAGEALGTWVRPEEHSISRRKFWLAYQSEPAGTVSVDNGAARALHDQGSSLLPVGVIAVEGNFQSGALVRIVHEGKSLGVGLSNYAAADLKKIMGLKRIEVAAILGDAHYPEVIHRDHLLVDAAI